MGSIMRGASFCWLFVAGALACVPGSAQRLRSPWDATTVTPADAPYQRLDLPTFFWFLGERILAISASADAANGGDRCVQGVFSLRHKMRLDSGCRNTCHALQNSCGRDFVLHDDPPQLPVIGLWKAGNFTGNFSHGYFL